MTNSFYPPNSFRPVQLKKIAGERARKKGKEWNRLIRERNRLKKAKNFDEVQKIEEQLLNDFQSQ
ncbi:MAG: hypothetical protein ACFBSE_16190 [Prochloraceae cyanobacterium]